MSPELREGETVIDRLRGSGRGAVSPEAREETTVELLGRLLDEALEALASAGHIPTRSGYCARCEGSCLTIEPTPPVPLAPHPWDQYAAATQENRHEP